MSEFKKFVIGFTATIAGIAICMGASYIQAELNSVVEADSQPQRVLSEKDRIQLEKLYEKQNDVVLYTMMVEELTKSRDKLTSKKKPSELDIAYINTYNSSIEEYNKKLSEMPSYEELDAQINNLLYYSSDQSYNILVTDSNSLSAYDAGSDDNENFVNIKSRFNYNGDSFVFDNHALWAATLDDDKFNDFNYIGTGDIVGANPEATLYMTANGDIITVKPIKLYGDTEEMLDSYPEYFMFEINTYIKESE